VQLDGVVVGEAGEPLPGATVTLAAPDGEQVVEATTDDAGGWTVPLYGDTLDDNVLVALVRASGYAEGRATFEINLRSPDVETLRAGPVQTWETSYRRLAAVRLAAEADTAFVEGRLVDGVTAAPVPGVPLSLQEGWNAAVGDSAAGDTVTGATGEFRFDVAKPGMYTVTAAEGGAYGKARFPAFLTATGGHTVGTVVPPSGADQLWATLVWGDTPFDLDLHLSAPLKGGIAGEDGTGQYHLWSAEPEHPDHVAADEVEAQMQRTDADGLGPECLSVTSLADQGEVRFSVFDNDNRSDSDTTALGDSGAVLQVWFGEDVPRYYTVAPGEVATLWHPVEIDVETARTYAVEAYSVGADPADPEAF
jgi:hypothetical protein